MTSTPPPLPDRFVDGFDPDNGHLFTFTVACRGTGKVVGDPHHTFDAPPADDETVVFRTTVQAWNLKQAAAYAARLELVDWLPPELRD